MGLRRPPPPPRHSRGACLGLGDVGVLYAGRLPVFWCNAHVLACHSVLPSPRSPPPPHMGGAVNATLVPWQAFSVVKEQLASSMTASIVQKAGLGLRRGTSGTISVEMPALSAVRRCCQGLCNALPVSWRWFRAAPTPGRVKQAKVDPEIGAYLSAAAAT